MRPIPLLSLPCYTPTNATTITTITPSAAPRQGVLGGKSSSHTAHLLPSRSSAPPLSSAPELTSQNPHKKACPHLHRRPKEAYFHLYGRRFEKRSGDLSHSIPVPAPEYLGISRCLCVQWPYDRTLFEGIQQILHDAVKDGDPVDVDSIIDGIKRGLEHLHQLGYIHGDINPHNIMLDTDEPLIPVIVDFDSCNRVGEKIKGKGGTFGMVRGWQRYCLGGQR